MDNLKIDAAMAYVKAVTAKNKGDLPDWIKYQDLVKAHLADPFSRKFKMPQEYYYAYLRGKGLSHSECLERMGISDRKTSGPQKKKSFWKFW
jgi:hypothetical protein